MNDDQLDKSPDDEIAELEASLKGVSGQKIDVPGTIQAAQNSTQTQSTGANNLSTNTPQFMSYAADKKIQSQQPQTGQSQAMPPEQVGQEARQVDTIVQPTAPGQPPNKKNPLFLGLRVILLSFVSIIVFAGLVAVAFFGVNYVLGLIQNEPVTEEPTETENPNSNGEVVEKIDFPILVNLSQMEESIKDIEDASADLVITLQDIEHALEQNDEPFGVTDSGEDIDKAIEKAINNFRNKPDDDIEKQLDTLNDYVSLVVDKRLGLLSSTSGVISNVVNIDETNQIESNTYIIEPTQSIGELRDSIAAETEVLEDALADVEKIFWSNRVYQIAIPKAQSMKIASKLLFVQQNHLQTYLDDIKESIKNLKNNQEDTSMLDQRFERLDTLNTDTEFHATEAINELRKMKAVRDLTDSTKARENVMQFFDLLQGEFNEIEFIMAEIHRELSKYPEIEHPE